MLILFLVTPLSDLWFRQLSGLTEELVTLSKNALWFALPAPALSVLQSYYQGILLNREKTRGITESVILFLLVAGAVLWFGIVSQSSVGINIAWIAFSLGYSAQAAYLWLRSRSSIRAFQGAMRSEMMGS
jgi:Na+-driven multidrug efflux pump